MSRAYTEGDYYVGLHITGDGGLYFVHYRVLTPVHPETGNVVFVDEDGARVEMHPRFAEQMRHLLPDEEFPEINLEPWRDDKS